MAQLSIIEFIVYGLVAYSGLLILITSIHKELPMKRAQASIRIIMLMPSIICMLLLSGMMQDITGPTTTVSTNTNTFNGTTVISNSTSIETTNTLFTLQNPVWVTLHFMFAILMIVYVSTTMYRVLMETRKSGPT